MRAISELENGFSIINLNVEWIEHRLLINESSLVKLVKSPQIYPFPLRSPYIVGTYYHNGSLVPVISLIDYFDTDAAYDIEIENILIVRTSDQFLIAFSNVNQSGFVKIGDLEKNENFYNTYGTIFKSNQFLSEEYEIKGQQLRAYRIDLDFLRKQISTEIRSLNNQTLEDVRSAASQIESVASEFSELENFISEKAGLNKHFEFQDQNDVLNLIFRIGRQYYAISTRNVLSILSTIPLTYSTDVHFDYFKGVIKTMYGSANVFDLRTYFGAQTNEMGEYILLRENEKNFVLVIDEIVSYFEIQKFQVLNNLYPITGTLGTFYHGVHVISNNSTSSLVFVLSSDKLASHLFSGLNTQLGRYCSYEFEDFEESKQIGDDLQSSNVWIGGELKLGFQFDQIKSIDSVPQDQFDDKLFTTFLHPIFGELPILNLNHFYKLHNHSLKNLVILQFEDEFFGIYLSGEITMEAIPRTGNLDNIGFELLVFENETHLIQDFAIFEDFIGYLINIDAVYDFVLQNKMAPITYVTDEFEKLEIDYFLVETAKDIYCIPLDQLESLIRTDTITDDIFDLVDFLEEKLEKFQGQSPAFCIKIKDVDQYFTTHGSINIVKFPADDINEELSNNPEKPQISLPNGKIAKLKTLKEVI